MKHEVRYRSLVSLDIIYSQRYSRLEAFHQNVMLWKIFQNSNENTCARALFK